MSEFIEFKVITDNEKHTQYSLEFMGCIVHYYFCKEHNIMVNFDTLVRAIRELCNKVTNLDIEKRTGIKVGDIVYLPMKVVDFSLVISDNSGKAYAIFDESINYDRHIETDILLTKEKILNGK